MFQYYMNLREQHGWNKVFAFNFSLLDAIPDFNWVRTSQEEALARFAGRGRKFMNAGWHFTYLGRAARIREKLRAFSHTEPWFRQMLAAGGIEAQIAMGFEVGNQGNFAHYCEIDASFPAYVQANLQKYRELGFIRDPYEALREMQAVIGGLRAAVRRQQGELNTLRDNHAHLRARLGLGLGKIDKE